MLNNHTLSLKKRLAFVSFFVLIITFSVIYLITQSAYYTASESRIQEALTSQTYPLMAIAEENQGKLSIPDLVKNERLDHLNLGWVAYVFTVDGELVWRSRSSDTYIALPDYKLNYSLNKMLKSALDEHDFFWVGETITWEYDLEEEESSTTEGEINGEFAEQQNDKPQQGQYLFLVGERKSILDLAADEYQRKLATWLSVSAIILIFILVIALNASLEPLKDARRQIELVSRGEIDRVKGEFPDEIQPLTSSINQLLQSERLQRKRYRDALGNLAHSLKTPLTVIKSMLQKPSADFNQQLAEQVKRIDDIVKYQLNRSVVTSGRVLNKTIHMGTEIGKIVDALRKVHADKRLSIAYEISQRCHFPGELGDLIELIGNLADNACKWAETKVVISGYSQDNLLYLKVSDDGPGIPLNKRQLILDRGKRLDQQAEGQGLGLSIVMDIIQSYRGELKIEDSDLGGSRFTAVFPT